MAKEILGTIECPICRSPDATIHQAATRKRALYIRCYEGRGGMEMRCGTLQCHGPIAQKMLRQHLGWGPEGPPPELADEGAVAAPAKADKRAKSAPDPEPAPDASADPARGARAARGLLGWLAPDHVE